MISEPIRQTIITLSKGNPGALNVLMDLYFMWGERFADVVQPLIKEDIRGPHIWILYKDRCEQDIKKFSAMLSNMESDKLKKLSEDRV